MCSRFQFRITPFTREFEIANRYKVAAHEDELAHLIQTMEQRMSAALISPAGHGKTTLLRALARKLPDVRYRVTYLKVADLSKRDFCREISHALGAQSSGTYPSLLRNLQERLSQIYQEGIRIVLILDEAHDFRPDVLGIIRLLTNFEMDSRLVVSIILAGQGGLDKLLKRDDLQDVASRLAHRARLSLLSQNELIKYMEHRCFLAGSQTPPFEAEALVALYECSHGNLRATDHLALKALHVAHDEDASIVTTNHITRARQMLT